MDADTLEIIFTAGVLAVVLIAPVVARHRNKEMVKIRLAQMGVQVKSLKKISGGEGRAVTYAFHGTAAQGQSVAGDARVLASNGGVEFEFAPGYVPVAKRNREAPPAKRAEAFLGATPPRAGTPQPSTISAPTPADTAAAETSPDREQAIRDEINYRLGELQENRDAFLANDRDGDGKVDSEEWDRVRARIEAEVRREFASADPAPTEVDRSEPAPTAEPVVEDGGGHW